MELNLYLLIAAIFICTFLLGRLLERIRVPWIFASLVIGALLAWHNPFEAFTSTGTFDFLATLGMYFLLFLVGLEIDVPMLKNKVRYLARATFTIVMLEGIVGSVLIHFLFGTSWGIALLVAMSFATVGEAILIPILDEFKIVNTPLGQSIIGIGTADDFVELLTLIVASAIIGFGAGGDIAAILISLAIIALFMVGLTRLKKEGEQFRFVSIESLFLFILFIFFLFVGIGTVAEAAPLAAILAGVTLRSFLPVERLLAMENEIRALTYGFFAPMFFVSVGLELNISYLLAFPFLVVLVVLVSNGAKIAGSLLTTRDQLGTRGAILLGIGLSVRFSTSIIIIKFLYDNGVVGADLYSVIIASSIAFKFIVPLLFSTLITRWGYAKPRAAVAT